nr:hypothetical protein 3 [Desulfobacterales bacterium]
MALSPVRIDIKKVDNDKWRVEVDSVDPSGNPPFMITGPDSDFSTMKDAVEWVTRRYG